jgi:hypothetical protein
MSPADRFWLGFCLVSLGAMILAPFAILIWRSW